MGQRVLVLLGHTDPQSFCAAMAARYAEAAHAAGHEIRRLDLAALNFDPVLHLGYRQRQTLEPALETVRADLLWADHLVIVFPIWWGAAPARLKGMFDRLLLPGFAFRYRPGKPMPEPLLAGRTAELLVSMDTPPWYYRWVYRDAGIRQIRANVLEFCGIRPVRVWRVGPLISSSAPQRGRWLDQVAARAGRLRTTAGRMHPTRLNTPAPSEARCTLE